MVLVKVPRSPCDSSPGGLGLLSSRRAFLFLTSPLPLYDDELLRLGRFVDLFERRSAGRLFSSLRLSIPPNRPLVPVSNLLQQGRLTPQLGHRLILFPSGNAQTPAPGKRALRGDVAPPTLYTLIAFKVGFSLRHRSSRGPLAAVASLSTGRHDSRFQNLVRRFRRHKRHGFEAM